MQLADEAQGRLRCGIVHADGSQLNLVGIIGGIDGCCYQTPWLLPRSCLLRATGSGFPVFFA